MSGFGRCGLLLLVLVCGFATGAAAHEVRPGYLELRELSTGTWDVLWKVPARGGKGLALEVELPADCENSETGSRLANAAIVKRWRTNCAQPLAGRELAIGGLATTRTDVLVRLTTAEGATQTVRLTPSSHRFIVEASDDLVGVARSYAELGIEHILLGIDHLLFVLTLLFLVAGRSRLIATVTAFTVAHSLTLAAATLGLVSVPQSPVEATIALSIVFVASEIINARHGKTGLGSQRPWLVAFMFGLLHGLGFAGALHEIGLPQHAIPLALAFFNVGVELGQLAFIAAVFTAVWLIGTGAKLAGRKARSSWDLVDGLATPAAYTIGTLATFWVCERTYAFFS